MSLRVARIRIALGAAAVSLLLSACATGPRPTLVDQPATSDTVTQAVLDRLERGLTATFTADYEITPSLTGQPTHATVMQSGAQQRVTIGNVDYFSDGTISRTCAVGGTDCVDSIDDARISNLSVTSKFWGPSVVSKLELDSARSVDASTGRTDTIASRPATCADVHVPSIDGVGSVTYCAVDDGVLARYFGADVSIELTSFVPTVDQSRLVG
jgi:hypothetical protein